MFFAKVSGAEDRLRQYYDSLVVTDHLVITIKNLTEGVDGLETLTVPYKDGEKHIITVCNEIVNTASKSAMELIKKYMDTDKGVLGKVQAFFKRMKQGAAFAYFEDEVKECLEDLTGARRSLELAISIVVLHKVHFGFVHFRLFAITYVDESVLIKVISHLEIRSQIDHLKLEMAADFQIIKEKHSKTVQSLRETSARIKQMRKPPLDPHTRACKGVDGTSRVSKYEQERTPTRGIEVEFDDGQIVRIPAGNAPMSIVTRNPKESAGENITHEGENAECSVIVHLPDGTPKFGAEDLVKFLRTDDEDGGQTHDRRSTPTAVLTIHYNPDFILTDLDGENSAIRTQSEATVLGLCVKAITEPGTQILHLTSECTSCCQHIKVSLLTGRITRTILKGYDYVHLSFALASNGQWSGFINPRKGIDVFVHEGCKSTCTHTLVGKVGKDGEYLSQKKLCADAWLFGVWIRHYSSGNDSDDDERGAMRPYPGNSGHQLALTTGVSKSPQDESNCVIL
ncbi:hypothetical protein BBAD15_g12455 [Beauveria bassiana D1-5]|uniref:Uncharacterized protein n=1 Tax=Beauveria bassiana D1-5 TaxID=1245745 RepID=A0A0A2V8A7_BEABA|nr:hypothetical protein BBAD15_g12455 [Beauveria bassiana D1-5]